MTLKRTLFLLIITTVVAVNCNAETTAPVVEESNDGLMVMDVWGRPLPAAVENGAFYMHIMNGQTTTEQLLEVEIDLCDTVEIHTVSIDDNGVMRMHPIAPAEAEIAPSADLLMKPGGLHVMCIGKTEALAVGDTVPLTLTFAEAGKVHVTADIRDDAVTESGMDNASHSH